MAGRLMDLRTALDRAYRAADRPPPGYTDARLTAGVTAIAAVVALE